MLHVFQASKFWFDHGCNLFHITDAMQEKARRLARVELSMMSLVVAPWMHHTDKDSTEQKEGEPMEQMPALTDSYKDSMQSLSNPEGADAETNDSISLNCTLAACIDDIVANPEHANEAVFKKQASVGKVRVAASFELCVV